MAAFADAVADLTSEDVERMQEDAVSTTDLDDALDERDEPPVPPGVDSTFTPPEKGRHWGQHDRHT